MADEKKMTSGGAAHMQKYFGRLPGQTLADFAGELKKLTPEDKAQLKQGFDDGTLTY